MIKICTAKSLFSLNSMLFLAMLPGFCPSMELYNYQRSDDELKNEGTHKRYYDALFRASLFEPAPYFGLHVKAKIKEKRFEAQTVQVIQPYFGLHVFYCIRKVEEERLRIYSTEYYPSTESIPNALDQAALEVMKQFLKLSAEEIGGIVARWNDPQPEIMPDELGKTGEARCADCQFKAYTTPDLSSHNPIVNNPIYENYLNLNMNTTLSEDNQYDTDASGNGEI